MKMRALILGLLILIAATSCANPSNEVLETFLAEADPILVSHGDITEETNASNISLNQAVASGDQQRALLALQTYRNDLNRAISLIRDESLRWRGLNVPVASRDYHRLILSAFLKETEGLQGLSDSYSTTLAGGRPDPSIINNANALLREAILIFADARQSLRDLAK